MEIRKKTCRVFFSLLTAFSLSFSLLACQKKNTPSGGENESAGNPSASAEEPPPPPEMVYGVPVVDFTVPQPEAAAQTVSSADFGMDPSLEDNTAAFRKATAYLQKNPGTCLRIEKGVYHFHPSDWILLQNIRNCVIDGNGAEFLFSEGYYFALLECDTLRFENLTVDWDWAHGNRLASLVRVEEKKGTRAVFSFLECDDASYAATLPWITLNEYDKDTLTPGCASGVELWEVEPSVQSKTHEGGNLVSAEFPGVSSLQKGHVYLIRHYTYQGAVFNIMQNSQNITLQDVRMYAVYGMGVIANTGAHHMLFSHVTIGLRPGTEDKYRISTTVDAFHLADTAGYFILDGCDVSFQGDDALNVHDSLGVVESIDGDTIVLQTPCTWNYLPGTRVCFKDNVSFTTYAVRPTVLAQSADGDRITLYLDQSMDGVIPLGAIAYNAERDSGHYIVRNCYFHENRARGLLLSSSNGLIENNRFYKTQGAAILHTVDICPSWREGSGVDSVVVRNNLFDTCNVNDWTPLVHYVVNIDGKPLDGIAFTNIVYTGNTFRNFPNQVYHIQNADGVQFIGNTIINDVSLPNGQKQTRGRLAVEKSRNILVKDNVWEASRWMADDVHTVLAENSADMNIVSENNVLS